MSPEQVDDQATQANCGRASQFSQQARGHFAAIRLRSRQSDMPHLRCDKSATALQIIVLPRDLPTSRIVGMAPGSQADSRRALSVRATMKIRKIVSTVLIAAMIFFAPSFFAPSLMGAKAVICASGGWLPTDTAFAQVPIPCPTPHPVPVGGAIHVPAWLWVAMACPASIILSGAVANFRDNRQLTYAEAWTCGLLYWVPWLNPPPPQKSHR